MNETWLPVPYAPFDKAYSVSSLGRIKPNTPSRYSKNRAEFLKPVTRRKYLHVSLYADGKRMSAHIHTMVALAFLGPRPFPSAIVCHKDDVRINNRADNLEWGTTKSNADTRTANGNTLRGSQNGHALLSENDVRAIRALYAQGGIGYAPIAQRFGVKEGAIGCIIRGETWRHV